MGYPRIRLDWVAKRPKDATRRDRRSRLSGRDPVASAPRARRNRLHATRAASVCAPVYATGRYRYRRAALGIPYRNSAAACLPARRSIRRVNRSLRRISASEASSRSAASVISRALSSCLSSRS